MRRFFIGKVLRGLRIFAVYLYVIAWGGKGS